MATQKLKLSDEVTKFLDNLDHPLRDEIEQLRKDILAVDDKLTETIKLNGPNFCFEGEDRLTMRVYPPKLIQLIFIVGQRFKSNPKID